MNDLKNVTLYITFEGDKLKLALLNIEEQKIFDSWEILLSNVVPDLPKTVEEKLLSNELNFQRLCSIYLIQKPSRWNSNRLVVTFVRTAGFALPISIYNLNLDKGSVEENEIFRNGENFWEFLKLFKRVEWQELKTLYNSCSITNT